MINPGTWLTLLFLLFACLTLLVKFIDKSKISQKQYQIPKELGFSLVLVALGTLLTLTPEYVYLRDQFGWRMNTIFKFYYQGWMFWSIAAAYGLSYLWRNARNAGTLILVVLLILCSLGTLTYPIIGIVTTTNGLNPGNGWTLDGNAYLEIYQPDDYHAMRWLQSAPMGVIAESIGGSYSPHARMATRSGIPDVIGWIPHEGQWRGDDLLFRYRPEDIGTLYSTSDWETAQQILERYQVTYIVIGDLERATYQIQEAKFIEKLQIVYQNASVTIYGYQPMGNQFDQGTQVIQ
jgi:uncharacterized membrane protein